MIDSSPIQISNLSSMIGTSLPSPSDFVEERQDVIFRRVRGILNKITPETFDKLSKELVNVGLDSPRTLRGVIYLLFDKALKDFKYSSLYAKLCQELSERAPNFEQEQGPNTFCKFLISKCEDEFERRRKATEEFDRKNVLTDEEFELRAIAKQKMLGNIKFICELGKKRLLQEEILHECIRGLLSKKKERSIQDQAQDLECLCQIMRTIGSLLDIRASKNLMNQYFERIEMFSRKPELPSRIRFMLRDVIDLRNNNWRPRPFQREDNVPQPISKLREEAGFEASTNSNSIDKLGNNKNLLGIGDLSKLRGGKLSMLLDDEPSFTTTTDIHWGPDFIEPGRDFDIFNSRPPPITPIQTSSISKPATSMPMNIMAHGPLPMSMPIVNTSIPAASQPIRHVNNSLNNTNSNIINNHHQQQQMPVRHRPFEMRQPPQVAAPPPPQSNHVMNNRARPNPYQTHENIEKKEPRKFGGRPFQLTETDRSSRPRPNDQDDTFVRGRGMSNRNHDSESPRNWRKENPLPTTKASNSSNINPIPALKTNNHPTNNTNININSHTNNNNNSTSNNSNSPPKPRRLDIRPPAVHPPSYASYRIRNNQVNDNLERKEQRRFGGRPFQLESDRFRPRMNDQEDSPNFDKGHGPIRNLNEPESPRNWRNENAPSSANVPINNDQASQPMPQNPIVAANTGTNNHNQPAQNKPRPLDTRPAVVHQPNHRARGNHMNDNSDRKEPRKFGGRPFQTESDRGRARPFDQDESSQLRDKDRSQFRGNNPESPRNWRKENPSNSPNNNGPVKDAAPVPFTNPILSKPPVRAMDPDFSLRPSHNLAGRNIQLPKTAINNVANGSATILREHSSSSLNQESNRNNSKVSGGSQQENNNNAQQSSNRGSDSSPSSNNSNLDDGSKAANNNNGNSNTSPDLYIDSFSTLLANYLEDPSNINRTVAKIKELKFPKAYQSECLISAMKQSILKSEVERDAICKLFTHLVSGLFEASSLLHAFKTIFEQMTALEVETPKVKSLVASLLSKTVYDGLISLEDVGSLLVGGKHHPLFLLFLQKLEKRAGQSWLSEKFIASKIVLMDMLPEIDRSKDRLAPALKDRCLGFLDPMLTVEPDLWEQMRESGSTSTAIYRWIKENVDQAVQSSPMFAHVMMRCLLRYIHEIAAEKDNCSVQKDSDNSSSNSASSKSSPVSVSQSSSDLEREILSKYHQVLQAILKDRQMQLASLYALQQYYYNLDFPKGSLLRWFHMMYDTNIVDDEVFFVWKEEINDEIPGKGQALFQVNTWLNWLAEDDSEEEDEE